MTFKHNKRLTQNAINLRKMMTRQENKLWYEFLRTFPVRVLRQKVLGNYIVDFYCSPASLAIEVDGGGHYTPEQKEYDMKRTLFLHTMGVEVLRISNLDVDQNFAGVCIKIHEAIEERLLNKDNK